MKYKALLTGSLALFLTACSTVSIKEQREATAESLYHKGVRYLSAPNADQNDQKAFEYFKAASAKDYAPAYNAMAVMYDEGIYVATDKKLALKYYEIAANMKLAPAQYNLAAFYYENDRTNPLLQKYLQEAIAQNDSDALNLAARIYLKEGQYKKAEQSFLKSAKDQNPDALFFLYIMNQDGIGIPKNFTKALSYLKQAADLNQRDALFTLGSMYLKGDAVKKDPTKAFQLLDKAARSGNTKAIVNLAIMYVNGEGVEQDTHKAAKFFQIAADQGDQQALDTIQTLHKQK